MLVSLETGNSDTDMYRLCEDMGENTARGLPAKS